MIALKQTQYNCKINGSTYFDDHKDFDGWNYLMMKIFQLPRHEKYLKVIEQRDNLKQKIQAIKEKQEQKRQQKMKKKMSSFRGFDQKRFTIAPDQTPKQSSLTVATDRIHSARRITRDCNAGS